MREVAIVGCSSVFLLLLFFMARVYFPLILRLMVMVLIKDGENSHLKEVVETSPEVSFISNIGYFCNAMEMLDRILVQQITHCHANGENYPRKVNVIERRRNFSEADLQSRDRLFSSSPPALGDT